MVRSKFTLLYMLIALVGFVFLAVGQKKVAYPLVTISAVLCGISLLPTVKAREPSTTVRMSPADWENLRGYEHAAQSTGHNTLQKSDTLRDNYPPRWKTLREVR